MIASTLLFPIIFLIGGIVCLTLSQALKRPKGAITLEILDKHPKYFALYKWYDKLFPEEKGAAPSMGIKLTGSLLLFAYAVSGTLYLVSLGYKATLFDAKWLFLCLLLLVAVVFISLAPLLLLANKAKIATLKILTWLAIPYVLCLFLLTYPLMWLKAHCCKKQLSETSTMKRHLLDLIKQPEVIQGIDPKEYTILSSLARFPEITAREVMSPRTDMFCLAEEETIYEAAAKCIEEGYSRIPLYKRDESIDHITGVLLYKHLLEYLLSHIDDDMEKLKETPVGKLLVPVLYVPENKKIHDLLQEVRKQQIHIAIVVNEYGCSEGIVTIEDILEEIVGEISDEHDNPSEEKLFTETNEKQWVVDAKMTILDAEKAFDIKIPHSLEYETIAGFISYKLGNIPSPGATIYHENFDIRVLSADKRHIRKVKITKICHPPSDQEDS